MIEEPEGSRLVIADLAKSHPSRGRPRAAPPGAGYRRGGGSLFLVTLKTSWHRPRGLNRGMLPQQRTVLASKGRTLSLI
ncbi:hypothetical protein E2C01_075427 [Portunus trituberculatus]|uniref:Uncharacterized protein n=1 Tax=Portunus trituberculatus TaxID=210409 RepID=A0A5B7IK46_PORTR|nr:hypothetical protein [Portunus trituberculatus]